MKAGPVKVDPWKSATQKKTEPVTAAPAAPLKVSPAQPAPVKSEPPRSAQAASAPVRIEQPRAAQPASQPAKAAEPPRPQPVKAEAPKPQPAKVERPKGNRISLELFKPGAKQVCVAGSFNEWKPEKTPLVPVGNGRWVGDLAVKAGRYEYLFVVDGQWQPDPNAKESVQNPYGGQNSVLIVSE